MAAVVLPARPGEPPGKTVTKLSGPDTVYMVRRWAVASLLPGWNFLLNVNATMFSSLYYFVGRGRRIGLVMEEFSALRGGRC